MGRTLHQFAVAVAAWASLIGFLLPLRMVVAWQSGSESAQDEGLLLLRNGSLLRGKITRAGDYYHVLVAGGEINVKPSDVELCCRTIEEAYQARRSLVRPGEVGDHLQLAQWCQRHGLIGSAIQELAEAKALDPLHPLIPLVERTVTMPLSQPGPATELARPVVPCPTAEDLDRMVQGMPPGSVESFTRTIQPLLVHSCSTAECHGPQTKSRYELFRIPPGKPPSRRLTQRNLHSTLQWIDPNDPAASPILTAPIRPHGSAQAAIFTDHQMDQYQQLVHWVHQVARKRQSDATVPEEETGGQSVGDQPPGSAVPAVYTAPAECGGRQPPDGGLRPVPPDAPASENLLDPQQGAPEVEATATANERPRSHPRSGLPQRPSPQPSPGRRERGDWPAAPDESGVKRGPPPPEFVPADPFDPEIFNRRFHR